MVKKEEIPIKSFKETVKEVKKSTEGVKDSIKMDSTYFDETMHLKKLGIELIDKVVEFLFHAKRMLKRY